MEQATGNGSKVGAHDFGAAMEQVMILGDLSPLTPAQRSEYYMRVCQSVGLNPLTKPLAYIRLNNKLTLYALRDCADQLRRIRGISIEIIDRKIVNGLLTVHVRAKDKDGRQDEDVGVVAVGNTLAGDAGANLVMKCITKAKRRVTLSICGLGMLDETEVTTIPGAEIIDADGVVVDAAEPPKRKFKTSAESKRDGTKETFNELLAAIKTAEGAIDCQELWDSKSVFLDALPRTWYDIAAQEYVTKMGEFGLEIEIEQQSNLRMS